MAENVLLINAAVDFASQNRIINRIISRTIPTSIGVLAGVVINSKVSSVKVIDEQIEFLSERDMERHVLSLGQPRIIGISVLTISAKRAYTLCKLIKRIDKEALVVLGGIHPTVLPDEALHHEGVDVVVRGEGEETFLDLVKAILKREDYKKIIGISYKYNGSIIHNPHRSEIEHLDEIPPFPYHLFEKNLKKYSTFGALFISRGCPYDCIFCSSRSVSGRRYRLFSIERVISEITLLVEQYKQKIIFMLDDNIAADRRYLAGLLKTVINTDLHNKAAFYGSMRGDDVNEEILDLASAANFKMISFGLETGSEPLMKILNKQETVKDVADAIKMTESKGIAAAATLIFGIPTETRRDRWDTIKLVRSLPISSVRFNTFTPYPGTPVFDMLSRQGRIINKNEWENFAVQYMWESDDLPYVPDGNNRYELMFDTMFANLSYYLSFNGLMGVLKSSFAGGNVINLQEAWYLSPKTIHRFFRVFIYLILRFLFVTYKMVLEKR